MKKTITEVKVRTREIITERVVITRITYERNVPEVIAEVVLLLGKVIYLAMVELVIPFGRYVLIPGGKVAVKGLYAFSKVMVYGTAYILKEIGNEIKEQKLEVKLLAPVKKFLNQ